MWSSADTFIKTAQKQWEDRVNGAHMFQLTNRLKKVKEALKVLNKQQYTDIEIQTHRAKEHMLNI